MAGFHTYIWHVNEDDEPEYYDMVPWVESDATEMYREQVESVFLKFVQKTVFVLKNRRKTMPIEIINLEGLTVDTV